MLTKKKFKYNLIVLKIGGKLNFLPVTVDVRTGEMRKSEDYKRRIYYCFVLFFLVDIGCITFRAVQAILFDDAWTVFDIPMQMEYLVGVSCVFVGHLGYFVLNPELTIMVFNNLFPENDSENTDLDLYKVKRKLWNYTGTELLARSLGVLEGMYYIYRIVAFAENSDLPYVWTSLLSKENTNWATFSIMFLPELVMVGNGAFVDIFLLIFMRTFYQRVSDTLEEYTKIMTKRNHKVSDRLITKMVQELKTIRILLNFFNTCNRNVLKMLKLYCGASSRICGFFAIRYFSDDPVTGIYTGVVVLTTTFYYVVLLSRAVKIPDLMTEYKEELRVRIRSSRYDESAKQFLTKTVDSIPVVGIQVSRYDSVERISALLYADFVAQKIVELLLTY